MVQVTVINIAAEERGNLTGFGERGEHMLTCLKPISSFAKIRFLIRG